MSSTTDTILAAAQQCFFRHGYGATNIAMISREAKISRVTIHKHFGSKDKLLHAVMERHLLEVQEQFPTQTFEPGKLWQTVEDILIACCRPLFEGIKDQWVLQELVAAGDENCLDLKTSHFNWLESLLEGLFVQAEASAQISLKAAKLTPKELAHTLTLTSKGLFTTAPIEEIRQQILRLLVLCNLATQVVSTPEAG